MARESPRRKEDFAGTQLHAIRHEAPSQSFRRKPSSTLFPIQLRRICRHTAATTSGTAWASIIHIYKDLVGNDFDCHNALADTEALADIMNCLDITEEKILNHSMTTVTGIDYIQTRKRISENLQVIHDKL